MLTHPQILVKGRQSPPEHLYEHNYKTKDVNPFGHCHRLEIPSRAPATLSRNHPQSENKTDHRPTTPAKAVQYEICSLGANTPSGYESLFHLCIYQSPRPLPLQYSGYLFPRPSEQLFTRLFGIVGKMTGDEDIVKLE